MQLPGMAMLVPLLALSLAGGEAPSLERRELWVGSMAGGGGVEWTGHAFALVTAHFDRPLYKAGVYGGVPVHTRFNSSGVDASLDGALRLTCAGAPAPLELRAGDDDVAAFWSREPPAALVPAESPLDVMREAAGLFDPIDASARGPAPNRVSVYAPLAHLPGGVGSCRLSYVPLGARPAAAAAAGTFDANATADVLDRLPAMLADFRGQEATLDAPTADAPGCERRYVLRLADGPAWDDGGDAASAVAAAGEAARPVFERAALLESRHEVGMPLGKMFKPIVAGVLEPVIKVAVMHCNAAMINVFVQEASHTIVKEVAPDVSLMLSDRLLANLTNILTDSMSYTLSRSLSMALTRALDPYLTWSIADALVPVLHTVLNDALKDNIPASLGGFVPEILNRVLPLTLVHSLTRSVPHVVVGTLTHTLTHSRKADHFCWKCFYEHLHCSLCHFSTSSMYYQIYHSAYYTDYYSNYYAEYYAQSLMLLDGEQYPNTPGTEPPDIGEAT